MPPCGSRRWRSSSGSLAVYEEVTSWIRPVLLDRLKMEYLLTQLDGICERTAKGELDDQGFLVRALEAGWCDRQQ